LVVINVRLVLPTLVVAVANLENPRGFLASHEERKAQFPRLRELLVEAMSRERTELGVLCGDFNTHGGSRSLEPLAAALRDVWPSSGTGWAPP
jgi:endonuclease/exonuclease/phosphatase family metal-dependent hydrolase